MDPHLSLLKSPSGSKVTQKRTRSSAKPMAGRAECSGIGSRVTPPGIDRADRRRNLPARIETIRHFRWNVELPETVLRSA